MFDQHIHRWLLIVVFVDAGWMVNPYPTAGRRQHVRARTAWRDICHSSQAHQSFLLSTILNLLSNTIFTLGHICYTLVNRQEHSTLKSSRRCHNKRKMIWSLDVFFVVSLNKLLSKQSSHILTKVPSYWGTQSRLHGLLFLIWKK